MKRTHTPPWLIASQRPAMHLKLKTSNFLIPLLLSTGFTMRQIILSPGMLILSISWCLIEKPVRRFLFLNLIKNITPKQHRQISNQITILFMDYFHRVLSHPTQSLIISGHEDRNIRFFDLNSGKIVHQSVGHTDAVTGLSIHPNNQYISSVGHDGSLRVWDIRNH